MKKQMDVYVPKIEFIKHNEIGYTSTIEAIHPEPRVIDLRNFSNKVFEILAKSKR